MRTNHLLVALATLAMTGCSQNEITEINPDANKAIGFGVYTGVQTKGTITDYNVITSAEAGFGVMGVKGSTSTLYMKDTKVQYSSEIPAGWNYSPAIYWPNDGETVSFYAFAPYNGAGISKGATNSEDFENTTSPSITLTLQTPKKMVDLVAAAAEDKSSADGTVSFIFNHALSRIALKAHTAKEVATGTTVKITGLKIIGSATNSKSLFYKAAKYDIKADNWTLKDDDKQSSDWPIIADGAPDDTYPIVDNIVNSPSTDILGDEYLFLIPVETSAATDAIQMELTYIVTSNGIENETKKTVSITTGSDKFLQKGKAYVIDFEITLNDISFIVNESYGVDGWENTVRDFKYAGNKAQTFSVPIDGTYKIEIWGNQGGIFNPAVAQGGKGGYTAGEIKLTRRDILNIYVGECNYSNSHVEGWNGGGRAATLYSSPGGGSIDVRFKKIVGNYGFDITDKASDAQPLTGLTGNESTDPRIIVGGGGGGIGADDHGYKNISDGGYAGGEIGGNSTVRNWDGSSRAAHNGGFGGTQTAGGAADRIGYSYTSGMTPGSAGRGGNAGTNSDCGGGGGGWFGGGGAAWQDAKGAGGGGGGSSHVNSTLFTSIIYKSGNEEFLSPDGVTETGHSNGGLVRITLLPNP